ncbi:hypothetical protein [Pseudacidovorax sp. NFM-22]|uniref:hypothetical protein n=1 Tax=Pseudacidovorax sp. NFM-22 TaxID=2744469 RepID=UPI001F2B7B48|nr:hypothetical protein [Pseudacidovorax sp. NFM-22]
MQLEQTIKPLNVAAATILIQLLFISLLAVAASLHDRRSNYSAGMSDRFSGLAARGLRRSPLLFIALFSLATLLVSEELYSIWSPIFQGVGINTVSATTSIALVFF